MIRYFAAAGLAVLAAVAGGLSQSKTGGLNDDSGIVQPRAGTRIATFSVDTASDSVRRSRDSIAQALLSAMEREAEEQAAAEIAAAESAPPPRVASRRMVSLARKIPDAATSHPALLWGLAAALALAAGALVVVFRKKAKQEEVRFMTTTRLSLMNREVQRACLYIEKNFLDAALTPDAVCAAIVTGRPFLEALFEKELGMGIDAYISQVREHRGSATT